MSTQTFRQYLEDKKNDETLTWVERTAYNKCYETWQGTDDHQVIDTIDEKDKMIDELGMLVQELNTVITNLEWFLECEDYTDMQIDKIKQEGRL